MNNLSVRSLQGLLLLFLDKRDGFANKNEEFYNPSIKKTLITINGVPHELFAAGLKARGICLELSKHSYKENSDMTWEQFLTTNFWLWIDTRASANNAFHGNGMTVEKEVYCFRLKKHLKVGLVIIFSLEGLFAHLSVTDPRGILRKRKSRPAET